MGEYFFQVHFWPILPFSTQKELSKARKSHLEKKSNEPSKQSHPCLLVERPTPPSRHTNESPLIFYSIPFYILFYLGMVTRNQTPPSPHKLDCNYHPSIKCAFPFPFLSQTSKASNGLKSKQSDKGKMHHFNSHNYKKNFFAVLV